MPCFRPVTAFQPLEGGAVSFFEKRDYREIKIPCGKCLGCKNRRREGWALRCYAEAQLHEHNWFITLTYDDEHYPKSGVLDYSEFQLFLKRARKRFGPFRFFMCGEYGERTSRGHFHALFFGCDIPDLVKCNSLYSVDDIFESEQLSRLWGKGRCIVGRTEIGSCRYVAKYCLGDSSDEVMDTSSGEILERRSFARMSLKPGIGFGWFEKYWSDLYCATDGFVVQGTKFAVPRYFDDKAADLLPELIENVKFQRGVKAALFYARPGPSLEKREEFAHLKRKFFSKESPSEV